MRLRKRYAILPIVVAIIFTVGYAAIQPVDYEISRDVAVNAPPEKIFPHIHESQKVNAWNPWIRADKTAKVDISGPEYGVGAKTSWQDGEQLGTGSATVTEVVPNTSVKTQVEFTKPNAMVQESEMTLIPQGAQTVVRWTVKGKNNLVGRIMCLFVNMDKMVGGMFEKGLADLKNLAEAP